MYHGRKKEDEVKKTESERKKEEEYMIKVQKINSELIKIRIEKEMKIENLDLTKTALILSSDFESIWEFRRELIIGLKYPPLVDPVTALAFIKDELLQIIPIIKSNPKGYAVWRHREWCIQEGTKLEEIIRAAGSDIGPRILNMEIFLCGEMLKKDERNFHVWNYRNWILGQQLLGCEGITTNILDILNKELEYTTQMIDHNFANYSAWFYRGNLLKQIGQQTRENSNLYLISPSVIQEELEQLKQAFYTEPKNQTVWNHHLSLITQLLPIQIQAILNIRISESTATFYIVTSQRLEDLGKYLLLEGKDKILKKVTIRGTYPIYSKLWEVEVEFEGQSSLILLTFANFHKETTRHEVTPPIRELKIELFLDSQAKSMTIGNIQNNLDKNEEMGNLLSSTFATEIQTLEELIEIEEDLKHAHESLIWLYYSQIKYSENPFYTQIDIPNRKLFEKIAIYLNILKTQIDPKHTYIYEEKLRKYEKFVELFEDMGKCIKHKQSIEYQLAKTEEELLLEYF